MIQLHYPEVFEHLKALSMPLEWYFLESFSTFFTDVLPSEMVFRLWDMFLMNLASTDQELKKKGLWYLLAVPLYLVEQVKTEILATTDPLVIK
jgi:hypothetical protein